MRDTLELDPTPPTGEPSRLIFMGGAIRHWWTCWGSPEHVAYVDWRRVLRASLTENAPCDHPGPTDNPRYSKICRKCGRRLPESHEDEGEM